MDNIENQMDVDITNPSKPPPTQSEETVSVPGSTKTTRDTPLVSVEWVPPPTENIYQDDDGSAWIHISFDDTTTPEELQAFLDRWPPSRTPESYAAWISVDREGAIGPPDIQGLQASFEALVASNNVTTTSVDAIAVQHKVLAGKWLIFTDWKRINDLWAHILVLTCLVRKKGSAKVSTRKERLQRRVNLEGVEVEDEERHVICVYLDDYTNMGEVKTLRRQLRTMGVRWKIGFKPDAYTHLGIYSKNKWGMHPTRYFF